MTKKIKDTAMIKRGFNGISIHLNKIVCRKNAKRIYKSFGGMLSWVGGIGIHAGLINQSSEQDLWVQIPYPAHETLFK